MAGTDLDYGGARTRVTPFGAPLKTHSLTVSADTCMTAGVAATARFGSALGDEPLHVAKTV